MDPKPGVIQSEEKGVSARIRSKIKVRRQECFGIYGMMPAQSAKRLKARAAASPRRITKLGGSCVVVSRMATIQGVRRSTLIRRGGALDSLLGGLWGKKAVGKRPKLH